MRARNGCWKAETNFSMTEIVEARVEHVGVDGDSLTVVLIDGRTVSVPIGWYPRLLQATPEERNNWRLVGGGQGIHWPDLDEDISVENLVAGNPSGESQRSFKRWLNERKSRDTSRGIH